MKTVMDQYKVMKCYFQWSHFTHFHICLEKNTEKNFWEEILLVFVPYMTQNTIGILGTKLVIYKISGHFIFITGDSDASSRGYCKPLEVAKA